MTEQTLQEKVWKALARQATQIAESHVKFAERQQYRAETGTPVIALCGPSACGKDKVAEFLSLCTDLKAPASLSFYAAPFMSRILGQGLTDCFERRHMHKMEWKESLNELRRADPFLLVRQALGDGDMLIGVRSGKVIENLINFEIVDHFIWVDRPNVSRDPTMTYDFNSLGFALRYTGKSIKVIGNTGDLAQLLRKTKEMAKKLGIFKQQKEEHV